MRHLAKVRVSLHTEVDVAAALIGIAPCQQRRDDLKHGRYLFGSTSIDIGTTHIKGIHIAQITLRLSIAQVFPVHPQFTGLTQNIIINIGHVLHVFYSITAKFQVANEGIKRDIGKGMSKMGSIVRRHTAYIDAYKLLIYRYKLFQRLRQRIKQFHALTLLDQTNEGHYW